MMRKENREWTEEQRGQGDIVQEMKKLRIVRSYIGELILVEKFLLN